MEKGNIPEQINTLKNIASIKMVAILFTGPEIKLAMNYVMNALYHEMNPIKNWCISKPVIPFDGRSSLNFTHLLIQYNNIKYGIKGRISSLCLPTALKRRLSDKVDPMLLEVVRWAYFTDYQTFWKLVSPISKAYQYMEKIVWKHEAKIDYATTARSMLKMGELNAEEKFRLISSYCLQDCSCIISPIFLEPCARKLLADWGTLLQYYWANFATGNLEEMTEMISVEQCRSYNLFMLRDCTDKGYWFAVEYFWNKVNVEEKIEFLIKITDSRYCGMRAPGTRYRTAKGNRNEFLKQILDVDYWRKRFIENNVMNMKELDNIWKYVGIVFPAYDYPRPNSYFELIALIRNLSISQRY